MLYLVDALTEGETTKIVEFHRDADGTAKTVEVPNYKPYFFVDEEAQIEKFDGVIKVEPGYTSIDNTPVKKVYYQSTKYRYPIMERVERLGFKHWEADVPFYNRYMIDLPEDIEGNKLKVCWFDIETASHVDGDEEFPDIATANQTICSISSRIAGETMSWLCGTKDIQKDNVRYFLNEEDMLDDFMSYIWKESPDVISAWNLDGFDLPYLITRCKRLSVDYKRLSKIRNVWERTFYGRTYYKVYGVVTLDLLEAYKLWRIYGNYPLLESYSLDFVSQAVLGDQKIEVEKSINYLWHHEPEKLIEYNQKDVDLLYRIDDECQVLRFFDELRRQCRCQFNDVYKTTALIDGYLLSRLNKKIILPTANKKTGEKFPGAYVFDPVPGVYDYVLCQDIASMYPSIIKNFNVSYETVGGGEIILPITPPISFSTKPGIIPMFLDELADERKRYKKLMYEATTEHDKTLYNQRQWGKKILMNSFYGYLGFPGARLYKRNVAAAITGMGQYVIKKIANWAEEYGNKVIYGDTDSVYVTSTKTKPLEVVHEGNKLAQFINGKLEELCLGITDKALLRIEFEKALNRVLFTDAKKRYAYTLLWDESKKFNVDHNLIRVQGFDSKRSDSNKISKIVQRHVIDMIIQGKSRMEVVDYLRKMYNKMRNGEFKDEEIGFPKGITKPLTSYNPPTAVVKGAKYSNDHFDTNFGKGSKPKFVYIKTYNGEEVYVDMPKKKYKLETIAYDTHIPKGFEVDWDMMAERTFKMKLIKIFEAVNWEWMSLDTKGLFEFGLGEK